MGPNQSILNWLTHSHREQAHSYRFGGKPQVFASHTMTLLSTRRLPLQTP